MQSTNIKIFKLQYSGKAQEIEEISDNIYDLFSPVNIIVIYLGSQKRLYVWIGSNASQTLKSYITPFRETFQDDFPALRVLRYITIDPKEEPWDFFQGSGLSKERLHEQIESCENNLLPVLSQIEDLQTKAATLFESESYSEAIVVANEILELAVEIKDNPLKQDQEEFIAECEVREKFKSLMTQIVEDKELLSQKIDSVSTNDDIMDLHEFANKFKEKYAEYTDLATIPYVQDLLEKEQEIWMQFEEKNQQTILLNDLKININELRKKAKNALNDAKLYQANDYFFQIIQILEDARTKVRGGIQNE